MHYFLDFSHLNSITIKSILQARKLEADMVRNISIGHMASNDIATRQNQIFEYSLIMFF